VVHVPLPARDAGHVSMTAFTLALAFPSHSAIFPCGSGCYALAEHGACGRRANPVSRREHGGTVIVVS
jgi:hypothetical protein